MSRQGRNTMSYRLLTIVLFVGWLGSVCTVAQTTTCGNTKLACLLPTAFHTNPGTFNFFNEAFATQVAQLPLATPASSFILVLKNGVPAPAQETFGPLVAERYET